MPRIFLPLKSFDGIRAILFDKDGTLTDSHVYWGEIIQRRVDATIRKFSLPRSSFDNLCLHLGYDCASKRLLPKGPIALEPRDRVIEVFADALIELGKPVSLSSIGDLFSKVHEDFSLVAGKYTIPLPGVRECLSNLRKNGITMAVVTSDGLASTEEGLAMADMRQFFSTIIGRESSREGKETGGPAILALNRLGIQGNSVIAVGDSPVDGKMAQMADLRSSIGVATGQLEQNALTPFFSDVIASLDELHAGG